VPNKLLLSVTFFKGGIASVVSVAAKCSLSASTIFSFACVFPRALEDRLFFSVVAGLIGFGGGDINAQSEPDD
jgi:hypothetical protein